MKIDRNKKYVLSRDVVVMFGRGSKAMRYEVKAPKGTRLRMVQNASGTEGDLLAIPPAACDAGSMGQAGKWSIFGHDSTYFYIWAPLDAIAEATA